MVIDDKIVDSWNKRFNRIEQSQSDDRKDIDSISIKLETIQEQNERILKMQIRGQEKVTEAVHDATSEVIEPLSEKVDVMIEKKVIPLNPEQVKKLTWLKKLSDKISFWKKK